LGDKKKTKEALPGGKKIARPHEERRRIPTKVGGSKSGKRGKKFGEIFSSQSGIRKKESGPEKLRFARGKKGSRNAGPDNRPTQNNERLQVAREEKKEPLTTQGEKDKGK